ncbi:GTPase Era [Buchnera aphidicola]|uniref:GTPase Era n=1 Tax=Buchnera aphidicola TaxID=9 RepID=UPI0034644C61
MNKDKKYCGYITIIGESNVGKSTLLNKIIGKKISIISRKKNTTQTNIVGIKTDKMYQSIYIDTPGINMSKNNKTILEIYNNSYKYINQSVLIVFMVDRNIWTKNNDVISKYIKKYKIPTIICINKIDKISDKNILLPYLSFLNKTINVAHIIPISAKNNENIFLLNKIINSYLPEKSHEFCKNSYTTNSHSFTISEIIREQFISFLGDEIPSILKVKIESLENKTEKELYIRAIIFINNIRQKKIIIGLHGEKIKKCSMLARYKIEKIFQIKVHLYLWVKEKK